MRPTLDHALAVVVLSLFVASAFFTARVCSFKHSLNPGLSAGPITSGQQGVISKVIDGDEVVVDLSGETVRVRILGTSSYDPKLSDPLAAPFGEQAVRFLAALVGKPVELVFDELKYDSRKRLLAYVQSGELDVGADMVSKGLVLTYTKFPFSRMGAYVVAEEAARENKAGLWADERLAERSRQLRRLWESQRRKGE
jgi:endonuclease YncB( thermonuclease family)